MPWSAKQIRTFLALKHGMKPKKKGLKSLAKLGPEKLGRMASEGVKAPGVH